MQRCALRQEGRTTRPQGEQKTGKLRFKVAGIEYEYDGDPIDLVPFIQQLQTLAGNFDASQTKLTVETPSTLTAVVPPAQSKFAEHGKLDVPSKPDMLVKRYIMSKPDYRHTLFEVQNHFFGRTFKSRGQTQRMYHRTAKQVRKIRKEIETEERGVFEEVFAEGGVKQFVFRKKADISLA